MPTDLSSWLRYLISLVRGPKIEALSQFAVEKNQYKLLGNFDITLLVAYCIDFEARLVFRLVQNLQFVPNPPLITKRFV